MTVEVCPHGEEGEDRLLCPPCQTFKANERARLERGEKGARFFGNRGPTQREHRTPRAIVARYDGECPECGSQIVSGETPIAKSAEDSEWTCAECVGAAL